MDIPESNILEWANQYQDCNHVLAQLELSNNISGLLKFFLPYSNREQAGIRFQVIIFIFKDTRSHNNDNRASRNIPFKYDQILS